MTAQLSRFPRSLSVETAFTVLAVAKTLKASGKDVVELEIGDSPFDSTASAKSAGVQAIQQNQSHYCPSPGIPEFREAAARFVKREFGIPAEAKNIVAGPGRRSLSSSSAKRFWTRATACSFRPLFSDLFAEHPEARRTGRRAAAKPGEPVPARRGRRSNGFSPKIKSPRAIFLNSPHNPTGGVATEDDLARIAELVRGKNVAIFSDEPYCHMVWKGQARVDPGRSRACSTSAWRPSRSASRTA